MNPRPRLQWGLCEKYCTASDRLLECEERDKRCHASCSKLGDDELLRIESGDGAWYYKNCKADCGLFSSAVLNGHRAVQCDSCDMWVHNECSFIAETQYETVKNTSCTWNVRNVNSSTFLIPTLMNRSSPENQTVVTSNFQYLRYLSAWPEERDLQGRALYFTLKPNRKMLFWVL